MDSGTGISIACIVIPIVLILGIMYSNNLNAAARERALAHAHTVYQQWLARLKTEPTNADTKQKTLEAGRAYSNLTREQKGVTVYDEMALMNDIGAATAGAASAPSSGTIEERLKRIDALKASGAITDAEHQAQRQKIVEGL